MIHHPTEITEGDIADDLELHWRGASESATIRSQAC